MKSSIDANVNLRLTVFSVANITSRSTILMHISKEAMPQNASSTFAMTRPSQEKKPDLYPTIHMIIVHVLHPPHPHHRRFLRFLSLHRSHLLQDFALVC